MAQLSDVQAIFESVALISLVISDGELVDAPRDGSRMFHFLPYVEMVETSIDTQEHTSDTRTRRGTASCRVVFDNQFQDRNALKNAIEVAFRATGGDILHPVIEDAANISDRLAGLTVVVTYFGSVAKT